MAALRILVGLLYDPEVRRCVEDASSGLGV